jgi:RNase adaptor protein for sRNA GlmZ degradation
MKQSNDILHDFQVLNNPFYPSEMRWTYESLIKLVDFTKKEFSKESVIDILELRNQKEFSLQKFEYNQLSNAIIAIKNLVPPDYFL